MTLKFEPIMCKYELIYEDGQLVFIGDRSNDDDGYMTVTNAIRDIVLSLDLNGRRLFYRDSYGEIDEVLHSCGVFSDFAPGAAAADIVEKLRAISPPACTAFCTVICTTNCTII